MEQKYGVDKVDIEYLTPKIIKMKCNTVWIDSVSAHYEKAFIEISKKHKINSAVKMMGDLVSYYLVFVD